MIVDTSALVAIVRNEPERAGFLDLILAAERPRISAAIWVETAIVVDARSTTVGSQQFDQLMEELHLQLAPVTAAQATVARGAYARFGKGSGHPASLNFGDCFSYALAITAGEPLLFKGNDFGHTDVVAAAAGQTAV